jgi:hypothetical protein
MPLTPGYGETPIPDDELASLLPDVVLMLVKPVTRAAIYDLEQSIQQQAADGNGCTTRLLADLVFAVAQDSDSVMQYDWNVDKASYINLLRRYDIDRDVTDLAEFLEVRPFGE